VCIGCHHLRSRIDQRIGIEGGNVLTPRLLDRRLSAWHGCLGTADRNIPFSSWLLAQLASVEQDIANMSPPDLRERWR
jgi:hypothetical protein